VNLLSQKLIDAANEMRTEIPEMRARHLPLADLLEEAADTIEKLTIGNRILLLTVPFVNSLVNRSITDVFTSTPIEDQHE
jgi:hypothetical protein